MVAILMTSRKLIILGLFRIKVMTLWFPSMALPTKCYDLTQIYILDVILNPKELCLRVLSHVIGVWNALMIKYTKSSTGLWFDLIYIWWNHLFTHSSFNSNPSHATDFRSSRVFCKKAFLKISKNSQKNTCARASF